MLFNSFEYAAFFPVVVFLYFAAPHRFRWMLLLLASYFFYACWNPGYLLLIMFTTVVDYAVARLMEKTGNYHDHPSRRHGHPARGRDLFLLLSLTTNLGLLFLFKYYNFFSDSLQSISTLFSHNLSFPDWPFLLPVGISFYTFQALSYMLDVYYGRRKAEQHLGIFALYIAFFPQLVAGPIERSQQLLPQFREPHVFDYDRAANGMKLIAWGLFKKIVVADRLSILVNQVYDHPGDYQGLSLVIATVFFAYQIYCDFSGYTDIAIGSAQVLGFTLMDNFRRPYYATSVSDFWHRWHISLSTWFRDYVYIPLGGSHVSEIRWAFNIVVVFGLSGFWHGANWTFLVWGLLHAGYMVLSRLLRPVRKRFAEITGLEQLPRLHRALQTLFTFALVCIGWVFFRASTIGNAAHILRGMTKGWRELLLPGGLADALYTMGLNRHDFWLAIGVLVVLETGHVLQSRQNVRDALAKRPLWLRWAAYSALAWGLFVLGVFRSQEFIYFTF